MLVADESVDAEIFYQLRAAGYEVLFVAELSPGVTDDEVLHLARVSGAVLLTADKDFGELVFRQGQASSGVVLLRLAGLPAATKAEVVAAGFAAHAAELTGSFAVLSPGMLRIRKAV